MRATLVKPLIGLLGFAAGAVAVMFLRPGPEAGSLGPPTAAERRLETVLPEVRFEATRLDGALESLQRMSGATIVVDWAAMEQRGYPRDTPVSMHVTDVTLATALRRLVMSVSPDSPYDMGYTWHEDTIVITGSDRLATPQLVRAYDVRDLIDKPLPLDAVWLGLMHWADLSRDEDGDGLPDLLRDEPPAAQRAEDLAFVISDTADGVNTSVLDGRLLVWGSWEQHRAVEGVLQQLRSPRVLAPDWPAPPGPDAPAAAAATRPATPPTPAAAEALRRRVHEVRLEAVPFRKALDKLARLYGATFSVDWAELKDDGFAVDTPVDVFMHDASLAEVLTVVLSFPDEGFELDYTARGDDVVIGSVYGLRLYMFIRVYDVRGLVGPDAGAPDVASSALPGLDDHQPGVRPGTELAALVDTITGTVRAESWNKSDWQLGAVRAFRGRLIIRQTWANHDRIEQLLESLRDHRPHTRPAGAGPATRAVGAPGSGDRHAE